MLEMRKLNFWLLVCSGPVWALFVPIVGWAQGGAAAWEFRQSYDLAAKGVVTVSNPSGTIRITSWDESRVQVEAVKRGRAEDYALVQVQVNAGRDRIEIETVNPRGRNVNVAVDYELKVPRSVTLDPVTAGSGDILLTGPVVRVNASTRSGNLLVKDIDDTGVLSTRSGNVTARDIRGELRTESHSGEVVVETIGGSFSGVSRSGNVRVTDVRRDATVSAQSGNIRLEKIGGRAIARTMSGAIDIRDVGGDVQASTLSDSVTVTDVRGRVNASSVSGDVTLRDVGLGARAVSVSGTVDLNQVRGRIEAVTTSGDLRLTAIDSPEVSAKAVSGNIRFAASLYPDGHYEFESFSNDVVIELPVDSQFSFSARSHSGTIKTDFPLTTLPAVDTIPNRGSRRGIVGKGGAIISTATFSGSVYLKKTIRP